MSDAPLPTAYGFDHSFTTFEGLGPRVLVSDEERFLAEQSDKLGEGPRFWELKTNLTGLYDDMTVDFVAQNSKRPWFVNLWLNELHDPWSPDDDRSEEQASELKSLIRTPSAVLCWEKQEKQVVHNKS